MALVVLCAASVMPPVAVAGTEAVRTSTGTEAQTLVDELRAQLAIRHEVVVEMVGSNARLVSVGRSPEHADRFHLAIEDGFFASLSPDERQAALAHELGHVWIFTNHPYLQTEQLANRIAMRVVSRDSLERLYEKMWARGGTKGDLTGLLGEHPHVRTTASAAP